MPYPADTISIPTIAQRQRRRVRNSLRSCLDMWPHSPQVNPGVWLRSCQHAGQRRLPRCRSQKSAHSTRADPTAKTTPPEIQNAQFTTSPTRADISDLTFARRDRQAFRARVYHPRSKHKFQSLASVRNRRCQAESCRLPGPRRRSPRRKPWSGRSLAPIAPVRLTGAGGNGGSLNGDRLWRPAILPLPRKM